MRLTKTDPGDAAKNPDPLFSHSMLARPLCSLPNRKSSRHRRRRRQCSRGREGEQQPSSPFQGTRPCHTRCPACSIFSLIFRGSPTSTSLPSHPFLPVPRFSCSPPVPLCSSPKANWLAHRHPRVRVPSPAPSPSSIPNSFLVLSLLPLSFITELCLRRPAPSRCRCE